LGVPYYSRVTDDKCMCNIAGVNSKVHISYKTITTPKKKREKERRKK